jgi:hypothetical protein
MAALSQGARCERSPTDNTGGGCWANTQAGSPAGRSATAVALSPLKWFVSAPLQRQGQSPGARMLLGDEEGGTDRRSAIMQGCSSWSWLM